MYFLNFSKSKVIIFCFTFFINLSVISQAAVIPKDDSNQIINYQNFRDIPITSELSNTGTIEFGFNHQNVNQNSVSNIFLGSLDNNSERNIHFEITVDKGVMSAFTVTFLYGKDSKSYDFYVLLDNETNKNTQDFNNIKMIYMRGHIQIFYGNKKTWKYYYPDFTIDNIRLFSSHGVSDVTVKLPFNTYNQRMPIGMDENQEKNINIVKAKMLKFHISEYLHYMEPLTYREYNAREDYRKIIQKEQLFWEYIHHITEAYIQNTLGDQKEKSRTVKALEKDININILK